MKFQNCAVLELMPSFTCEEFAIWHFRWNPVYNATLILCSHMHTYMDVHMLIIFLRKIFVLLFFPPKQLLQIFNS